MIDVVARIQESRKREPWPRHTNYLSDIGHACERYLTYARTHWDKRNPPSDYLLSVFREGEVHEKAVRQDLLDAGFEITEVDVSFVDQDLKLSGKIDGVLKVGHDRWILEIKSMSPYIWQKIDTYEDMIHSDKPWIRHYPAQMQCYLHYDREKNKRQCNGLFILKNKATGELKQIEVKYDQEMALQLMLKAERVNRAVDKVVDIGGNADDSKLPDRISYAEGYCERCDFRMLCLPDVDFGPGVEVAHDEGLLDLLRKREDLVPAYREYQALDRIAKNALRGRDHVLVGEFECRSKANRKKSYTVKAHTVWATTIHRRRDAETSE